MRLQALRLSALAAALVSSFVGRPCTGATVEDPAPLFKVNSAKEDYLRVAPGGRYFVHSDGRFYIPLGYNHNPDWDRLWQCAPGRRGYKPQITERYFSHLRDCGVNLLRMMIECPAGSHYLENPIGTFRPGHVAWIDNIMTHARKYGVRLMFTPWDTYWMNHRWDSNPYNIKLGGPVDRKSDFITKRAAIEVEQRRWKFIIDRWGNTGTIFAWELLNESDYWWGASPEQVSAWATEMGRFVRDYEQRKWGRTHLITISTGRPMPEGAWGDLAYRLLGLDLASTHLYIGAANAPEEPIKPALAIQRGVSYALANIRDQRPYLNGEDGPINRWIADPRLDNEVFHNMSWAHLASGGAGSGLRWPYRNPHHLSEGMLRTLSLMSGFVKAVPWAKLCQPMAKFSVKAPEDWIACHTATKQAAIVWLTRAKTTERAHLTFNLSWPSGPSRLSYRAYDTKVGKWLPSGSTESTKGELAIALTAAPLSIALILQGS